MQTQKCKNCHYYSAYYKQYSDGYFRLSHGHCSKYRRPQTQYEICENFKNNEQKEQQLSIKILDSLELAITSIIEIAHILKEKESESKNSHLTI